MVLSEAKDQSDPRVRETAARLERRMVPVDMHVGRWLDRKFVSQQYEDVIGALETHGQVAEKLRDKRPTSSDYEHVVSQWRGACTIYAPERVTLASEKDNPLLDALVYVFSALQDYEGAAAFPGGPFLRAQKTRGVSINPITDEEPWNPNQDVSRSEWKRLKPRQSVILANDAKTVVRAVKGAEKVPEAVMRTLTLLSVAAEEDPSLLTQAFNWFKFRVAHVPNGVAPALGVLEIADRLGQKNNPAFAPLLQFLPWYVREHAGNSDKVIGRYKYVSNPPQTGLLYRTEGKPLSFALPDAKRIRDLGMRLESMEDRMRQMRGSQNLVLAAIGVKDLSRLGQLREQIAAAKSEQKRLTAQYFSQWNRMIDGVAQSVHVSDIIMKQDPDSENTQQVEELLDALFGGTPFVPSKATSENETYSGHVATTRWAANNPLVRLRYLMDNPTFEVAMAPLLKGQPQAVFELMKQTYANMLREKYLVRSDKVDRFLRLTTRETVEDFEEAMTALVDSYPGHYLGRMLSERHAYILARYRDRVNGKILSRVLDMRAIRRAWKYKDAKKAYVWNYRRDLMYLTLIATTMMIAWNADVYLGLMRKADELSQKWGLSLDSITWKLPDAIEDWAQGKRDGNDDSGLPLGQNNTHNTPQPLSTPMAGGTPQGESTQTVQAVQTQMAQGTPQEDPSATEPAGAPSASAAQPEKKQPEVLFEPPDWSEKENESSGESGEQILIRYAKIIQQPDVPVEQWYMAMEPGVQENGTIVPADKVQRVLFFLGMQYPEDTLVLEATNTRYFYAPPGWEIVDVFTMSDAQVMQTREGAVQFLTDPGRVLVVYRQLPSSLGVFQAETVDPYDRAVNDEAFGRLNSQLVADPVLQGLHSDFLHDLEAAQTKHEESEVVLRYVRLIREHISRTRQYSNTTPGLDQNSDGIVWVANHADEGFECEVAHRMVSEFLNSAGVLTQGNPGEPTVRFGNGLWGDTVVHLNTRVILPDGRIVIVDLTPLPGIGISSSEEAAVPPPVAPDFFSIYRDEILSLAVGAGLTIGAAAALIGLSRSIGKRRRDRRTMVRGVAKVLENGAPIQELPTMDASETELVLAMALHITTLPQEDNTDTEIGRTIRALSQYRPRVGVHGRASYIVDVAANDETAMSFLTASPETVMRQLAQQYGSRKIHASTPEALTEEIARYERGKTAVSAMFIDYVRLVKAMWGAMSGFAELRASVVGRLMPQDVDLHARIEQARALIKQHFKETSITSENKYAVSMLWALDAVLKVTAPKPKGDTE